MKTIGSLSQTGIKPLCPTRWTVRTGVIDAVIVNYSVLLETMKEIAETTKDEYGLKANEIFAALGKFHTLFDLKLGHLVFSAAEKVSRTLRGIDTSIQEAMKCVEIAKNFYRRHRVDVEFEKFYALVFKQSTELGLENPRIGRRRRLPLRLDDGSAPHTHETPKDFYRQQYFEACDILLRDLEDRFCQEEVSNPLLSIESLLVDAANGREYEETWEKFCRSFYKNDLCVDRLYSQLKIMCDTVHEAVPQD